MLFRGVHFKKLELVSAWAIVTSEKRPGNISIFSHFLNICEKHGLSFELLQNDLDYIIMTDYILSNRDRHLNNIAVLRDAETLKFLRLSPIFDSGKSMFVHMPLPARYTDIVDGSIQSFTDSEKNQLQFVKNKRLFDCGKLLDSSQLASLYAKDPNITPERIEQICTAYEIKAQAFCEWQNK